MEWVQLVTGECERWRHISTQDRDGEVGGGKTPWQAAKNGEAAPSTTERPSQRRI